jgi:hypothetical protein
MGYDEVAAIAIYCFCISVRALSGHPRTDWTKIRIVVQVVHRAFVIYLTLVEASNWKNGHPTAMIKDWLEDDMAYAVYLPVLLLEFIDASLRISVSKKRKEYVLPTAKVFLIRCLPDLAVASSIFWLGFTIAHLAK